MTVADKEAAVAMEPTPAEVGFTCYDNMIDWLIKCSMQLAIAVLPCRSVSCKCAPTM